MEFRRALAFEAPETSYLAKVGSIAYAVSSMEWTLVGDMSLLNGLPPGFSPAELEGKTTGAIGNLATLHAPNCTDPDSASFLTIAGDVLTQAKWIRNDLLHARPATHPDGRPRLYRTAADGQRFWIDDAWLDDAIGKRGELARKIDDARVR